MSWLIVAVGLSQLAFGFWLGTVWSKYLTDRSDKQIGELGAQLVWKQVEEVGAELEKAHAALAPFAQRGEFYDRGKEKYPDDAGLANEGEGTGGLTIGNLRAAAKALEETK